jgi:hypothetical protein
MKAKRPKQDSQNRLRSHHESQKQNLAYAMFYISGAEKHENQM